MAVQTQQPPSGTASGGRPAPTLPRVFVPPALPRARRTIITWATKTLKGQFITQVVLLLIIAIILGLIARNAFLQAHDQLDTIAASSARSIDAAQAMGQYIQDMDTRAADYLATAGLTNLVPCTLPVTKYQPGNTTIHDCDDLTIEVNITRFNQVLSNARQNIAFPGQRTAIERITAGFEEYVGYITLMRNEYNQASNKTNLQDEHIRRAHDAYKKASNVLLLHISRPSEVNAQGLHIYTETNIPSCVLQDPLGSRELLFWEWPNMSLETNIDCLSSISKARLDSAYAEAQNQMTTSIILLSFFTLAVCVFLVVLSVRMALITHRLINPGLALATILAIVFSIPLLNHASSLAGHNGTFKQIVKDDYDSIYYATTMNRYASAANADELRWLIALQDGDEPQVQRWADDWDQNKQRVEKLIMSAKQNRTWPEEDKPLADIQQYWTAYTTIDSQQVRPTAQAKNDPQRFNKARQISSGQGNQTFSQFSTAVQGLSAVNRGYFDRTYADASASTASDSFWYGLLFPFFGLLAVWGVWLRQKDF